MVEAYRQAFALNPKDANLCLALGVLSFIQRDFKGALGHFKNGIRENPTDHTLWNKYGAALANDLQVEEAIKAYHQALDLRPNYVRTMANIGLAHRTQARFEDSVPYFLNALVLNPNASSVWRYLRSSFLQMNRMDLVEKLNLRDPSVFRGEFSFVMPNMMMKPTLERLYEHPIWNE